MLWPGAPGTVVVIVVEIVVEDPGSVMVDAGLVTVEAGRVTVTAAQVG